MDSDGRDPLLSALHRWRTDDRHRSTIEQRSQSQVHEQLARDEMRLTGLLLDCLERRLVVVVRHDGGEIAGTVSGVGADHVALTDEQGTVLLRTRSLMGVTLVGRPRRIGVASARLPDPGAPSLADVLGASVEDRPWVQLHLGSGAPMVTGELYEVGTDVVVLGVEGSTSTTFVALDAVTAVRGR